MSPLVQLVLLPVAFAWLPQLVARLAGSRALPQDASMQSRIDARWAFLGRAVAAFPLGLAFSVLRGLAPEVLAGPSPTAEISWVADAGLDLRLRLDPLALVACGLTLLVALIATLCARPRPDAPHDDAAHLALTSATLASALCDTLPGALAALGVMTIVAVGIAARTARHLEFGPQPGDGARAAELDRKSVV